MDFLIWMVKLDMGRKYSNLNTIITANIVVNHFIFIAFNMSFKMYSQSVCILFTSVIHTSTKVYIKGTQIIIIRYYRNASSYDSTLSIQDTKIEL